MVARMNVLTMPGAMLERGFWLYVWRVDTPKGERLYVGRTGDNSTPHATPPYQRMGQHLGHLENQNMLRQHLEHDGIVPEDCASFQLITFGPLFPEARDMNAHRRPRDIMAALEKELADALLTSGYHVMNTVKCRKPLNGSLWVQVREAFSEHFPGLRARIQAD